MANVIISSLQKNRIIFLRQKGLSVNYISEFTGIHEYHIKIILVKIFRSENHIFVTQSLEEENTYFVFVHKSERKLFVDNDLNILNKSNFDVMELEILNDLYGFRI